MNASELTNDDRLLLANGGYSWPCSVSESYTWGDHKKHTDFHAGKRNDAGMYWPIPPPPAEHGYIYMPGTCSGWWSSRAEVWFERLIHPEQYLEALETALDHGWNP